jgi:hypothetical protein
VSARQAMDLIFPPRWGADFAIALVSRLAA